MDYGLNRSGDIPGFAKANVPRIRVNAYPADVEELPDGDRLDFCDLHVSLQILGIPLIAAQQLQ